MILGFGINDDLNEINSLKELDQIFINFLKQHYNELADYRNKSFTSTQYSDFLVEIAPYLDDFLSILFGIEQEVDYIKRRAAEFDLVYECKRKFVQRIAVKTYAKEEVSAEQFKKSYNFLAQQIGENFTNHIFAQNILHWLDKKDQYQELLSAASKYGAYMSCNAKDNILFNLPQKIDQTDLLSDHIVDKCSNEVRYGFEHKNNITLDKGLNEAKYCIYCHKQNKDSCSIGLPDQTINKNGCPLKQKISEMNIVSSRGFYLAALAIIMIDNPMVALTGHRICNDCSKSCIFQKQEPVDVPQVESGILQTTLNLPWGLEIYSLLTRWNPLNLKSILPKDPTEYNILIAGLGPAGIALSHYLLNSGHNVVAIEGLKINPPSIDAHKPIKYWHEHKEKLEERVPQGFGGVAEFGITSRWDKNNLKLVRIILQRHKNFKIYDSTRLGSNITIKQAFALGFDHIAMCTGAGAPKFFKNKFCGKGIKTAAEFLMNLQSAGAFLPNSNANLVIRLPVAVIGCGLTAIDAAVEAINYYPVQVEKFLASYEILAKQSSLDILETAWNAEDKIIANEFISHARLFRIKTKEEVRDIIVNKLGGVSIYYHDDLKNSAAYKLNHEEMAHAIAAGIKFIPYAKLVDIEEDEYNYCSAIRFEEFKVLARTILVAIGIEKHALPLTTPNISYFGDADPNYSGSVVRALASVKYGYEAINYQLLQKGQAYNIAKNLDYLLTRKVEKITHVNDKFIELIIKAPLAAANFKPGQFFKLQNYSSSIGQTMESLALTGAKVDQSQGTITFFIEKLGVSSSLCAQLIEGEKIALMGPNGHGFPILENKTILLIGSGIRNLQLLPIAELLRENNCQIIHIAHYINPEEELYRERIENHANYFIKSNHYSLMGDIEYIITKFASAIDHVICATSLENAQIIKAQLRRLLPQCSLIYLTNTSMQCMMQGVCGQCIVSHNDGYIFSCKCTVLNDRDINLTEIKNRLTQNTSQEKLSRIKLQP